MDEIEVLTVRAPRFYRDGVTGVIFPEEVLIPTIFEKNSISSLFLNPDFFYKLPQAGLYTKGEEYLESERRLEKFLKEDNIKWRYLKKWVKKLNPKLVLLIRRMVSDYSVTLKTAEIIKKINKDIKIGLICTSGLNEALLYIKNKNIDFVTLGDPENTVVEIYSKIKKGGNWKNTKGIVFREGKKIIFTGERIEVNLNVFPIPNRDLVIDRKKYWPSAFGIIECGRGCIYSCSFCDIRPPFRLRDPKLIVKEIMLSIKKYGTREFWFMISSFLHSKKWAREVCNLITKHKLSIIWGCYVNANELDEESIKMMKRAGCYYLGIGIESGSYNTLLNFKKVSNIAGKEVVDYKKLGELIRSNGMLWRTGVIFGNPNESIEDVAATIRAIRVTKPDFYRFQFLIPKVDSELYFYLKKRKLLLNNNLDFFTTGHLNIKTKLPKTFYKNIWITQEKLSSLSEKTFLLKKFLKLKILFLKLNEYFSYL